MFVKSLRLAGFKSFADPTILEFQPGVNVIVGPNGSGKSNIADGLSWVLGSQAPSSLRGGSMEDVVFAGSAARPRLALADVELTLDNSSGVLPLDISEVTISRSIDRAGTSEYRINGAPCRLLDIAELLSDTGVGRTLHTVVGQGQLDTVLQARPEDRRIFIEEAAQIGKYRRRKDRALRKLERVDDNVMRLNDVLTELRRALRPLKRQASAAAAYSELLMEHRVLRQRLASTEIHRLAAEDARLDVASEQHRVALLSDELGGLRARLGSAAAERQTLADDAAHAQRVADGIGRASDRLAALGRLATERAATLAARLAAETEQGYRERIRLLDAEKARWSNESVTLEERRETARAEADRAIDAARAARTRLSDAEIALASARSQETAAAEGLVRAEGAEAAGRATLGSVEARVRAAEERRDVTARELAGDLDAIVGAEREVQALETDLDRVTEAAAAAEMSLEDERDRLRDLRRGLDGDHADRAAADARVRAFEDVIALFEGRSDVVDLIAPLVDDARRVAALTAASEQDARVRVEAAEAEVERRWIDVSRHDEELRRLDALTAGAAERLAGARRRHEVRSSELAARDEELARAREALAAAERAAGEERARIPAQSAALEEARRIRLAAEAAVARRRETVEGTDRAAASHEMDARAAAERHLAARLRVEEAEAGIADARSALAGLEDRRARLDHARRRAQAVAELADEAHRASASWAQDAEAHALQCRSAASDADRRLTSMRARELELEERLDTMQRRLTDAEVNRAQIGARTQALAERAMDEWGLSLDALKAQETFRPEEENDARERVEKLDREMRRLGAVNPRAAEEFEELAERERFLVDQIEDLKSSRRDLLKIVREVDDTIVAVFSEAFADVAREFEDVFQRLFPGGEGRLKLTAPEDPLVTGIEVEARPPGKNVKKLSLLSGGERSLVALAFLFAIFRARPSPFYLLDEVEAALDDINLVRFLGLIAELEERAQVLVVTHQKRTMEAADVLYGVTMSKDGVSRVIAKRMEEVSL